MQIGWCQQSVTTLLPLLPIFNMLRFVLSLQVRVGRLAGILRMTQIVDLVVSILLCYIRTQLLSQGLVVHFQLAFHLCRVVHHHHNTQHLHSSHPHKLLQTCLPVLFLAHHKVEVLLIRQVGDFAFLFDNLVLSCFILCSSKVSQGTNIVVGIPDKRCLWLTSLISFKKQTSRILKNWPSGTTAYYGGFSFFLFLFFNVSFLLFKFNGSPTTTVDKNITTLYGHLQYNFIFLTKCKWTLKTHWHHFIFIC